MNFVTKNLRMIQSSSRLVGILLYFAMGTNMITIIISDSEIYITIANIFKAKSGEGKDMNWNLRGSTFGFKIIWPQNFDVKY